MLLLLFHVTGISYNKYPYFLSFFQVDHNSFYDNYDLSGSDWSRAMFDKSTDPGNNVMLAQFLFLFLMHSIFLRNFNGNGHENCQCYCKKQINKIPCSVLLSTIKMTSNCSKFCSETTCMWPCFHLSFEHFHASHTWFPLPCQSLSGWTPSWLLKYW